MKYHYLLIATLGLVSAGVAHTAEVAPPASRVEIAFVNPEKFTDAANEAYASDRGREEVLANIKQHVEKLARYYVADGEHLELRFLDIDLAGAFEPWHGPRYDDIRILKEIYPPRMTVEFRLLGADGKVISEGKRDLSSPGYLMRIVLPSSDSLRFDKEMLGDWMRQEFRRKA